jgi:hypothetical protein
MHPRLLGFRVMHRTIDVVVRSVLLVLVLNIATVVGKADVPTPGGEFFYGTWKAGDEAGAAIYGEIKITGHSLSWEGSRSNPKCRTTYTVVDRTRGPKPYPDEGWPWKDIPSSATYETVKIRLGAAKCLGAISYFRFAIASDNPGHLDVVEYIKPDKPNGWFSYGKK